MREFDYTDFAQLYDILENSRSIATFNGFLDDFFAGNGIESVLDMTCGTGVQAIYLHEKGYDVTASDLNEEMLEVARSKSPNLDFHQANMIDVSFDRNFDAIISIFNAIGHLTREEFGKTLENVVNNLVDGGHYIFDIFNYDFMKNNFILHEFMDVCKEVDDIKYVRFNDNELDREKQIMQINQKILIQKGVEPIMRRQTSWDMQIYTLNDLRSILKAHGLKVVKITDMTGNEFVEDSSLSIVIIAQKP